MWQIIGTQYLEIAILGAVPGHPLFARVTDSLPEWYEAHPGHSVPVRTGPYYFQQQYLDWRRDGEQYGGQHRDFLLFRPSLFYPYIGVMGRAGQWQRQRVSGSLRDPPMVVVLGSPKSIPNEAYSMTTFARVGGPAPDFAAPAAFPDEAANSPLQTVSLADYAGRWLVFFWYPLDFTTVCPTEITALSDRMEEFADLDTAILGASTDSVHSHRAWLRTPRTENGIADVRFPLLADKTGRIARDYGVLLEDEGNRACAACLL